MEAFHLSLFCFSGPALLVRGAIDAFYQGGSNFCTVSDNSLVPLIPRTSLYSKTHCLLLAEDKFTLFYVIELKESWFNLLLDALLVVGYTRTGSKIHRKRDSGDFTTAKRPRAVSHSPAEKYKMCGLVPPVVHLNPQYISIQNTQICPGTLNEVHHP